MQTARRIPTPKVGGSNRVLDHPCYNKNWQFYHVLLILLSYSLSTMLHLHVESKCHNRNDTPPFLKPTVYVTYTVIILIFIRIEITRKKCHSRPTVCVTGAWTGLDTVDRSEFSQSQNQVQKTTRHPRGQYKLC